MFYYNANDKDYSGLLLGCKDGYVRVFDKATKSDNVGATNEAISSYAAFAPVPLGDGLDYEGKIKQIVIEKEGVHISVNPFGAVEHMFPPKITEFQGNPCPVVSEMVRAAQSGTSMPPRRYRPAGGGTCPRNAS